MTTHLHLVLDVDGGGWHPAAGRWSFAVRATVADAAEAVSDVAVTDGVRHARVIAFFEVRDGAIGRMIGY